MLEGANHSLFLYTCQSYTALPRLYILLMYKDIRGREEGAVSKLKLVEIVVLAATALLTAARSVIKFLEYMGKLKAKRAECAA